MDDDVLLPVIINFDLYNRHTYTNSNIYEVIRISNNVKQYKFFQNNELINN